MEHFATNIPGSLRMLDVMRGHLAGATEFSLSVSFLRSSGLQLVASDLRAFAARGGRARVLTSTYLGHTQPGALRVLSRIEGVEAKLHFPSTGREGFHPKFMIFEGTEEASCWVGSSNLSKGGLTSNIEANLKHDDPEVVAHVLSAFDEIWAHEGSLELNDWVIAYYERTLQEQERSVWLPPIAPPTQTTRTGPEPNEAQREALAALARLRRLGERRAVAVAATGVGKTYLAAFDAKAMGAESVLFVSHRLEHLSQAEETFGRVFGGSRSTGMVHSRSTGHEADLVFSTVRSAVGSEVLMRRRFDYVVVDEFHHAAAASYRRLLDTVEPDFLLGLTATPERQDGHDVLELCDYNIAYEVRLIEAIRRSWLIPFHYFGISDDTVDYDASFWRSKSFDPDEVENALMLDARVEHVLEHARDKGYDGTGRVAVGFCAGRRHARFMAEKFNENDEVAVALTGEDSLEVRQEVYARLQDPRDPLEWLFVSDLLNEGVDIPRINTLLFLRPTQSATVFIQQLGRGLRLSPDCEVLTVLDFVGRHRNAWAAIDAMNDTGASRNTSTRTDIEVTPPPHCEIVLDDKTVEVLREVQRFTRSKRDRCSEAYRQLRSTDELGRPPFPVDLFARVDVPELGDFRAVFKTWVECRKQMGDAEPWEKELDPESLAYDMLQRAERDWQQQRVYAYALFWGLCDDPDDPEAGYERFFERFPRWRDEYAVVSQTSAWRTLGKKLGDVLDGRRLADGVAQAFPDSQTMKSHVERRLRYTLERDYRTRHAGVLSTPDTLVVHRKYGRPEIINHFGLQYDPARHNRGVLEFEEDGQLAHIVMITKLDTSNALSDYQYENAFDRERRDVFYWQSQNRQRQDNDAGRRVLDHVERGITLHLFVQKGSGTSPTYMGPVRVLEVEGDAPMNVTFRLAHVPPQLVLEDLAARTSPR
jgi:superfamily II DNA or RNA helicase